MQACLELLVWGDFSGYQHTSLVLSGYQTQISSGWMIQQKQPGPHQIDRSQRESPEPTGTIAQVLCHFSQQNEDHKDYRPTKRCKTSYARVLSLSLESYLYTFSKYHVPSMGLTFAKYHMKSSSAKQYMQLHYLIYLETSTSPCPL